MGWRQRRQRVWDRQGLRQGNKYMLREKRLRIIRNLGRKMRHVLVMQRMKSRLKGRCNGDRRWRMLSMSDWKCLSNSMKLSYSFCPSRYLWQRYKSWYYSHMLIPSWNYRMDTCLHMHWNQLIFENLG